MICEHKKGLSTNSGFVDVSCKLPVGMSCNKVLVCAAYGYNPDLD